MPFPTLFASAARAEAIVKLISNSRLGGSGLRHGRRIARHACLNELPRVVLWSSPSTTTAVRYSSPLLPAFAHRRVNHFHTSPKTMAIEVFPLPAPPTADAEKLKDFGREVRGVNPGALSPEEFKEVHDLLYKVTTAHHERRISSLSYRRSARCASLSRCRRLPRAAVCFDQGTYCMRTNTMLRPSHTMSGL